MNYWIFQYTTTIYKNVIKDLDSGKLKRWEVTKHRKNIKVGDKVILYIGGEGAKFIYGTAKISSEIFQIEDGRYFIALEEIERLPEKVSLHRAKKDIPTLKIGISGTNFSCSEEEYTKIKEYPKGVFFLI